MLETILKISLVLFMVGNLLDMGRRAGAAQPAAVQSAAQMGSPHE